jgi:hypothetical protein
MGAKTPGGTAAAPGGGPINAAGRQISSKAATDNGVGWAPAHKPGGKARRVDRGATPSAEVAPPVRPGLGDGLGEPAAGDCADGNGLPTDPMGLAGEGAAKGADGLGAGCVCWPGEGCGRLAGEGLRIPILAGGGLWRKAPLFTPPGFAGEAGVNGLLGVGGVDVAPMTLMPGAEPAASSTPPWLPVAVGLGGLSSSPACDCLRCSMAASSAYLSKKLLMPCMGCTSWSTLDWSNLEMAPSRTDTMPPARTRISRQ